MSNRALQLTFKGFAYSCYGNVPSISGHLQRSQQRIHFLRSNPTISRATARATPGDWMPHGLAGKLSPLLQMVVEPLRAAYRELVAFINDIPNLQYLAFYEMPSIDSSMIPPPPFPDETFGTYDAFDRTQHLEYQVTNRRTLGFERPSYVEAASMNGQVEGRYIQDILESVPIRLVSAKLSLCLIAKLAPSTTTKLNFVRQFRHWTIVPYAYNALFLLDIPGEAMPHLESYMGPAEIVHHITQSDGPQTFFDSKADSSRASPHISPAGGRTGKDAYYRGYIAT
ncbi:hypothetical protein M422DRAFT_247899 [Sphaerobolus stellatus SS14]|nr:hypothetical protein M422DRAFT_247899 [Sphaerobolus stellatus SS14]